jgi:hypothetical protein
VTAKNSGGGQAFGDTHGRSAAPGPNHKDQDAAPRPALKAVPDIAAPDPSMDATEARAITDKIKRGLGEVKGLIIQAYHGRAWMPLGYKTWDEYVVTEFGSAPLMVPREDRPEMVRSLRQQGFSMPAIATTTGASTSTVHRDIEGEPTFPDGKVDDDEQPSNPIRRLDGKRGPAKQPRKPAASPQPTTAPTKPRRAPKTKAERREIAAANRGMSHWAITLNALALSMEDTDPAHVNYADHVDDARVIRASIRTIRRFVNQLDAAQR